MAEPVSLVASGLGIADVTVRLIAYLKDVKASADTIEETLDALLSEVDTLKVLHGKLEELYKVQVQDQSLNRRDNIFWFHTGKTLKQGQTIVNKLESCVKEIYGKTPQVTGARDALTKQHRKRSRENRLSEFRDQIHSYNSALQTWLSIISLFNDQDRHADILARLNQLQSALLGVNQRIEGVEVLPSESIVNLSSSSYQDFHNASIAALGQISSSVKAIEQILNPPNLNKHFDTPESVDEFYTGRHQQAEQLADWMFQPRSLDDPAQVQKRFVVYGIGGSGKTQFCCKFANDNRERFWGVFWVDARSVQRLKQTFHDIARVAGVGANVKAVLHWLSNLEARWLLIIDNADDPDVPLDEYLPKGNRGHVLITTRNPAIQFYGNIGPRCYEFRELDDNEASSLLLKAAEQARPWNVATARCAEQISKALGYLALAIAVAGAAIREKFCQIHEYLDYHEEQRRKSPSRTRSQNQSKTRGTSKDSRHKSAEAAFDISFRTIASRNNEDSSDALQLLKTFAFLHCENIRFEFLEHAVLNGQAEREQQVADKQKEIELEVSRKPRTWSAWSTSKLFEVLRYFYRSRGLPVLPDVLRAGRVQGRFDRARVRAALRRLSQCSLIKHNDQRDSFSMHPLVHKWARETPDMHSGEQSVWAEAAAMLLSSCILLPPLGTTTKDEEIRKDLLPHVDHVRDAQASLDQRMKEKRMGRMKPWPVFEGGFSSERALMYAKFSIVYAQNGRWEDAKTLQIVVKDFTTKVLGLEHPVTRRITLALATTLWQLGECDDAAEMQEQVVKVCTEFLGPHHHDTLVAMQSLGESRFLQGRFSDARNLQEEAAAGLEELHGLEHEDTLNAIDYLGRTVVMFYNKEDTARARSLHRTAMECMQRMHGAEHLRTLTATEHFCVAAIYTDEEEHLLEAHDILTKVVEIRKTRLGREHGYTLLAMASLARVKKGLGYFSEAEQLILTALPIAERNLGADHVSYLWGQYHLASIWVKQKRWTEAEQLLVDIIDRQMNILQGRGRYHPDRIGALVELATVYNVLGKHQLRDQAAEDALHALSIISVQEHPVALKLKADLATWRQNSEEQG